MRHHEGFDFVPGNRSLSAVEAGLMNVMSRETVLWKYVDNVKREYNRVLLGCRPLLKITDHQRLVHVRLCADTRLCGLSGGGGRDGTCRHGAKVLSGKSTLC